MAAVFEWPVRVYIEDTDAGGIVYYVNYLKFIERARTEFLRNHGFGKQFIFNADLMFVVHSLHCEYIKPAQLDDELIATAELVQAGKANLLLAQQVYRLSGSGAGTSNKKELLFRAEVKLACVKRQSLKPQRIPADMLAAVSSG